MLNWLFWFPKLLDVSFVLYVDQNCALITNSIRFQIKGCFFDRSNKDPGQREREGHLLVSFYRNVI